MLGQGADHEEFQNYTVAAAALSITSPIHFSLIFYGCFPCLYFLKDYKLIRLGYLFVFCVIISVVISPGLVFVYKYKHMYIHTMIDKILTCIYNACMIFTYIKFCLKSLVWNVSFISFFSSSLYFCRFCCYLYPNSQDPRWGSKCCVGIRELSSAWIDLVSNLGAVYLISLLLLPCRVANSHDRWYRTVAMVMFSPHSKARGSPPASSCTQHPGLALLLVF